MMFEKNVKMKRMEEEFLGRVVNSLRCFSEIVVNTANVLKRDFLGQWRATFSLVAPQKIRNERIVLSEKV